MPLRAAFLRQALDMYTTGVNMMRQNLRRAAPEADADEIGRRLTAWLHTRPGAEAGDCEGRGRAFGHVRNEP